MSHRNANMEYQDTLRWFRSANIRPGHPAPEVSPPETWPPWCDTKEKREEFLIELVFQQTRCETCEDSILSGGWQSPDKDMCHKALIKHNWDQFAATASFLWNS